MSGLGERCPVIVLTGFLGAGKTTMLNRWLDSGDLDDAALLINEFGPVSIDHELVETAEDQIIALPGGCLCCSLRGDLADALVALLDRTPAPRRIVIETSGIAEPGPILQTLLGHPVLAERVTVEMVVALIDAATAMDVLDRHPETRDQLKLADVIVTTRTDLEPLSNDVAARIRSLAPVTPMLDPHADDVSIAALDERVERIAGIDVDVLSSDRHHAAHAEALVLEEPRPISQDALLFFIDRVLHRCGGRLLRMKGVVCTSGRPGDRLVVQLAGGVLAMPEWRTGWNGEAAATRLVLILSAGADARAIVDLFAACVGKPGIDQPDRAAIEGNPLAIPGMG